MKAENRWLTELKLSKTVQSNQMGRSTALVKAQCKLKHQQNENWHRLFWLKWKENIYQETSRLANSHKSLNSGYNSHLWAHPLLGSLVKNNKR